MTEQTSDIRPAHGSGRFSWHAFILGAVAFILPVLLIPLSDIPVQMTKTMVAVGAVALLIIVFALSVIRNRSVAFSLPTALSALLILPFAYLASALFSAEPAFSLWGHQLEADTFAFVLLASALSLAVYLSATSARRIFSSLLGFLAGGTVVVLFQVVQLLVGGAIPLALFSSPVINLIGSWNGLAVFLGLLVALVLVALESLPLSTLHQWLLRALLFLSLVLMVVVNFSLAWILVGTVAFAVFVHNLVRSFSGASGKGSGATAVIILLAAAFFVFAGSNTALWVQNTFGIQTLDVRPSAEGTLSVALNAYATNPLFGSGPNTFASQWLDSRPQAVIATPFWDIAFPSGFASIPSAVATGGAVVLLAWLFVLITLGLSMMKALLSPLSNERSYFLISVSAAASLYLLLVHLFYVPDAVLTLLMFFFFGLFLASMREAGVVKEHAISFSENPRLGFFAVLLSLVLAVGALIGTYGAVTMYASALHHQSALSLSAQGDLDGARAKIVTAISLSEQDRHYRVLAAIELGRLSQIVNSEMSDTERQTAFREVLTSAINASVRATELNPGNYSNWISRSSVYGSVVPLNIDGAYEGALQVLEEARLRNPLTPEVDFRLAQLKAVRNDREGARVSALVALEKKADYTPAILLIAEISLAEGKLDEAIKSVEAAVFLEPQNTQLLYQLGLLKLQAEDNAGARDAFTSALRINPDYANASFFLGQAQYLLGDVEEAVSTFRTLKEKNSDNEVLQDVLEALEKGENPFQAPQSSENVQTPTQ